MNKLPAFQFYPGDWQRDPNLKRCDHAAKGVMIDCMCLLFDTEERGVFITGGRPWTEKEIIQAVGGNAGVTAMSLDQLLLYGALRKREKDGAIYSARMVRDEQERSVNRERQARFRDTHKYTANASSNGDVTPPVTPVSHPLSTSTSSSSSSLEFHSLGAVKTEAEFLKGCEFVLGKKTMKQWGGLWRKRIREKPEKVKRVLLAMQEEMKTRMIKNPGGYADDLFTKRFAD